MQAIAKRSYPDWRNPEQAAEACKGNWEDFESFGWHDQPEDAENWALFVVNSRDAGMVGRSNYEAIKEEMAGFDDAHFEFANHWACGWVEHLAIRVTNRKGQPTAAFVAWCEIQRRLDDYPLLDDEAHSRMEYEETIENIDTIIYSLSNRHNFERAPGLASRVFSEMWNSDDQDELQCVDDRGAYPSDESVLRALSSLKVLRNNVVGPDDLRTDARRLTFWQWGRVVVTTTPERWAEDVQAYFDGEKFRPKIWEEQADGGLLELDLETGNYAEGEGE